MRCAERWADGPAPAAILALTVACLVAFAATIPLPRVDGQLVGSDGVRYFVYLPSVLLDGDLDFADEYAYFYGYHEDAAHHVIENRTATGLPANRFGIGPAVLWSPFFLAAHVLALALRALGLSVAADGYGYLYQAPVLAGSILYGGLGAWLCFKTALRVASQRAALAATLLTVLAGNLVYYLTVEPSMSHALSVFASGAFFYAWMTVRENHRCTGWLGLGGLAGLMTLIRPQDGLFLVLPILDLAWSAQPRRRGERLAAILAMTGTAVLTFAPQLAVWKLLNGGFLRSGYSEEFDVLFHWSSPKFFDVLFSAQRGLFLWHPIFLLAVLGLSLVFRRDPRLATLGLFGFAIQWVLVSFFRNWAQGDAFGGRMFIVCSPIFVVGMAAVFDRAARRWPWRGILGGGALLVLLNFLLLLQYRLELLSLRRPLTFIDLAFGRFTFLL